MASSDLQERPAEVAASKVLRRAAVSKMTRTLQNRLALATVKIQNGWGTLPLETIEPRIEQELKRKRPTSSSNDALSDTSSSIGDALYHGRRIDSSPLTAPLFSDDFPRSGSSRSSKRSKHRSSFNQPLSSTHERGKMMTRGSWKKNHRLPESSPGFHGHSGPFSKGPPLSFVTEATVPDDNLSLSHSEDDDSDLPLHSFQANTRHIRSSPPRIPRTPSPDVARSARMRNKPFNNSRNDDAADLLMFLAASPSPAVPGNNKSRNNVVMNPPSTPPQKTPLPSSMLSTPGGGSNYIGFGTTTPGMGFNFADYLNVTPSPAQAAWRTPGPNKTPLAAREARRRLNFDMMPPSNGNTPELSQGPTSDVKGLGMELGGELVSSQ
ncbi:hypothetical protein BT63DRAFT_122506 [Microthyrium microscopicum]|uniref:Uncharacterized protein n=1 Tax=Microthyrium microscopicum TaxID=703497 RepID=A0A6A6TUT5_9PEZI|nr:hypothetical protein BT63DRAFT_122506 [Microthyrium microscopicum]